MLTRLLPALLTVILLSGCANSVGTGGSEPGLGEGTCKLEDCGAGCVELHGSRLDRAAACYQQTRTVLACLPAPDPAETAPGSTGEGCFVDDETGETYIFVESYGGQELPGFSRCEPQDSGALAGCD